MIVRVNRLLSQNYNNTYWIVIELQFELNKRITRKLIILYFRYLIRTEIYSTLLYCTHCVYARVWKRKE